MIREGVGNGSETDKREGVGKTKGKKNEDNVMIMKENPKFSRDISLRIRKRGKYFLFFIIPYPSIPSFSVASKKKSILYPIRPLVIMNITE